MNENEKGQVTKSAAEVYEDFFVPALFGQWSKIIAKIIEIEPNDKVLDVGCGTGILARTISDYCDLNGTVTGIDINEGMLSVAIKNASNINWKYGRAEKLPFDDNSFDAVVSQFALMFFEDKISALKEMMRVLKPEGKLLIAVWDSLENTPGYFAMSNLLQWLFGEWAADSLRSPYSLGNKNILSSLFTDAGIRDFKITTLNSTAQFPSIRSWVYTEIKGWTLADKLDENQFNLLLKEAEKKTSTIFNCRRKCCLRFAGSYYYRYKKQNHLM